MLGGGKERRVFCLKEVVQENVPFMVRGGKMASGMGGRISNLKGEKGGSLAITSTRKRLDIGGSGWD